MEPEGQSAGPPDSVRAAAAALRSRRHAEMLFTAVADLLGDAGWQETENGGAIRRLFRRDPAEPTQIVPWPVLELTYGSRSVFVADWMGLGDAPTVEPPPPPKLRGLGPGEIRLLDGAEHIEIAFNEAGAKFETSRSHHAHPLPGLASALAGSGGNAIELLARFIAALDPGRHGPGRVLLPVAMPHGAAGVWRCGLHALRRALFGDGVSRGPDWLVADGLTGRTLGSGASREQAWTGWRAAVVANSPWPAQKSVEPVEQPPDELPPGAMRIRGPSPDVPMPARVPGNVPAALVRLTATPAHPPASGSWVALLGARGATCFAACRRKRQGFTLVGQHVLAALDLARMEAEMDRADELHEARMREVFANTPGGVTRWPCRTITYRVGDDGKLAFDAGSEGPAWHAGDLDGDLIAHRVVRQRWSHGQ